MAVLFSDPFNRPDTVTGPGGNWEITRGNGARVAYGQLVWSPEPPGFGARVDPSKILFPADQYAEATIVGAGSSWTGIGARVQANPGLGEQLGYFLWVEGSGPLLALIVWGRGGQYYLANREYGAWAGGERLRIETIDEFGGNPLAFLGVRVNGYVDGALMLTALHSNSPWLSGQPGYNNYGAALNRGLEDFVAGDFSIPTPKFNSLFFSTNF